MPRVAIQTTFQYNYYYRQGLTMCKRWKGSQPLSSSTYAHRKPQKFFEKDLLIFRIDANQRF